MAKRQPGDITLFCSSDLHHPLAAAIRKIDGGPYSHAGLCVDALATFEARFRVEFYEAASYTEPCMRYKEFRLVGVSEEQQRAALYMLRRRYEHAYYPIGQMLAMLPWALWRRVGVRRAVRVTRACVCSELVWRYVELIGGNHFVCLRKFHPRPNEFTPNDLAEVCEKAPSLFQAIGF